MEGYRQQAEEDPSLALAKTVVQTEYANLSREAIESTKKSILDTLGTILAASTASQGCQKLAGLAIRGGGVPESTVIAFGGKLPCWMAAFANGAMAHALDYDDHLVSIALHPSCTTVPAAFAVAEHVGSVSGEEFLTAVTLGNEVICRLGLAVRSRSEKWMLTVPMGGFSAAAAAGKLLRLKEDQITNAFGLALCQGGGARAMTYGVGSELRGMYAAFPNKVGVLSALMAQEGITGPTSSLEGKAAFFEVFADGDYDRAVLTDGLGKRFESADISIKPWPCCGANHAYIEATLQLASQHDIHPEEIDSIIVSVGALARQLTEPLEARRKPNTSMDAKYSIPFSVATAVVRRKVSIKDFVPASLKDPTVLQVAAKVTPRLEPKFSTERGLAPGKVEIKTKAGKTYAKQIDVPYGHPCNPISMESLIDKFIDCASFSAKPLSRQRIDEVVSLVNTLEEVEDVSKIVRLLG